jgi:hypothetical protein
MSAGFPCGIADSGAAGGISILCGGIVNARLGVCSGACSNGCAGVGTSAVSDFIGAAIATGSVGTGVGVFEDSELLVALDTGPRLATMAAASADIGEVIGFFGSSVLGVEGPDMSLGNRGLLSAGDRFDGNVLLLCTPEVVGVAKAGVMGLGTAPECRERFDDVDTFRRTPLYLRTLSAPALEAADAERPRPELLRPGVVGVLA